MTDSKNLPVVVVGAGFAGAIVARELAERGIPVRLIERRSHIGGNAFDEIEEHGLLVHRYGPHIFHTNSQRIFDYLSRFTEWRPYEHRVLAEVDGKLLPIPINRTTINSLYGLSLDESGVAAYFESVRVPFEQAHTSEEVVLASVGHDLCEKFFRGYTRKQWGLDLSQLAASVAARIPTRSNDDDRYFTDKYQVMPTEGYTVMFERILAHPLITIELGVDYLESRINFPSRHIVFTGRIDAYFDYCHGRLPYRSLRFEHEHIGTTRFYQATGTINYPNRHAYTRVTEFKHLTGQNASGSSIVREYPEANGEPYYPVPRVENEELYRLYKSIADTCSNVTFVGRLAEYRYYNMDQAAGAAIAAARKLLDRFNGL